MRQRLPHQPPVHPVPAGQTDSPSRHQSRRMRSNSPAFAGRHRTLLTPRSTTRLPRATRPAGPVQAGIRIPLPPQPGRGQCPVCGKSALSHWRRPLRRRGTAGVERTRVLPRCVMDVYRDDTNDTSDVLIAYLARPVRSLFGIPNRELDHESIHGISACRRRRSTLPQSETFTAETPGAAPWKVSLTCQKPESGPGEPAPRA